jgi:hypothetical protein
MRTVMMCLINIESRNKEGKPHIWTTYDKKSLDLLPGEKVVDSHIVNHNDSVYIVYVIKEGINLTWMWVFLPFILLSLLVYLKYKYHF